MEETIDHISYTIERSDSIPTCLMIGQLVRNKKNKCSVDDFDDDRSGHWYLWRLKPILK